MPSQFDRLREEEDWIDYEKRVNLWPDMSGNPRERTIVPVILKEVVSGQWIVLEVDNIKSGTELSSDPTYKTYERLSLADAKSRCEGERTEANSTRKFIRKVVYTEHLGSTLLTRREAQNRLRKLERKEDAGAGLLYILMRLVSFFS